MSALFHEEDWEALRRIANFGGTFVLGRPQCEKLVMALEAAERLVQAAAESELGKKVVELQAQLVAMDARLLDANPEIARLRDLQRVAQRCGEDYDDCPWCTFMSKRHVLVNAAGPRRAFFPHAPKCPVFEEGGKMRLTPLVCATHEFCPERPGHPSHCNTCGKLKEP